MKIKMQKSKIKNQNENVKCKKSGFTLVELVVYIAISTTILLFVALFAVQLGTGITREEARGDEEREMLFVIERVTREIQNSSGVDTANSLFGAHPSRIALRNASGAIDMLEFVAADQSLRIVRSSGSIEVLTSADTDITEFIVRNLSRAKRPGVLHIRIVPETLNVPFETTVSFREPITL